MYEPVWEFPTNAAEAAEILRDAGGDARAIAGGTDLTVLLRTGAARPRVIVDLGALDDLRGIELGSTPAAPGRMGIGALVTHGELAAHPLVLEHAPVLAEACRTVGSPQIRARGTIGGNVVHASPAADGSVALLALDAAALATAAGGASDREALPLEGFFTGPGETALRPHELIRGIAFDCPPPGARSVYLKAGQRNALAIAIVSVAAIHEPDGGLVRIALGSVAPTPIRAREAEDLFLSEWDAATDRPAVIDEVAKRTAACASPIDDVRASARYRTMLVEAMTRDALRRVCLERTDSSKRPDADKRSDSNR